VKPRPISTDPRDIHPSWARQRGGCFWCGRKDIRHEGRGLCKACYSYESRWKSLESVKRERRRERESKRWHRWRRRWLVLSQNFFPEFGPPELPPSTAPLEDEPERPGDKLRVYHCRMRRLRRTFFID
jgi:hypothetical protein